MIRTVVIIIILHIGIMEGTNFDDVLAQVKATNSETSASPDVIGIVLEDEAALVENSLGL